MGKYDCFSYDLKLLCETKNSDVMIIFDCASRKTLYSYADVWGYIKRFLAFFRDNGLQRGDTVVSVMPNSPEAIICFFAALVGGMNYAPIPCTVSRREYDNWIRLVHPKMIIRKAGIVDYHFWGKNWECSCDGDLSWLPAEECCPDCCLSSQIYLMTSGTTGLPKAMSINSDKLWSSGKAFARFYEMEESEYRFWNYLPMSYLGGLYNLAMIPLCSKGSFVISESFSGKTILNYWNFVENNEITALWLVPSIVQGLLKLSKLAGGKLTCPYREKIKIAFLGTAPIQLSLKEEFEKEFGICMYENFALSESTFLTAEDASNICFREQNSVGKKLPYVSLKMVSVEGIENSNVIWVKTPFLFDGYLSEDGITELVLDDEGYFNTKDLGYLNENGMLILSGRNRDIIKKGGLFISLIEIENVVGNLANIENVAAVPIKHSFYGETYVLCVVFREKSGVEKQKEYLRLWMLDNFVSYKMPDKIYAYNEFPMTASGKVQKFKLIEEIEKNKL